MEENIEPSTDIETYIIDCNRLAMDLLSANNYKKSFSLLRRAETVLLTKSEKLANLTTRSKLLAITFNNLACYYKRKKQLNVAYKYLQQALKLELQFSKDSSIAGTYLNLCAILSHMSRHEEAKLHAEQAVNILENVGEITHFASDTEKKEVFQRSITIVIGLHNLGAELEHLQRFQDAIITFEKGLFYGRTRLGPSHPLTKSLEDVLKNASNRYLNVVSLRNERETFRNRSFISPGRTDTATDSEARRYIIKVSNRSSRLPSITPPRTRNARSNSCERSSQRSHASFTSNESSRRSPTMLSKLITSYKAVNTRLDSRKVL